MMIIKVSVNFLCVPSSSHPPSEENPEKALKNFRECLKRINSIENYNHFYNSGFNVILRDDNRTIEETLELVEIAFKLK